MMDKTHNEYLVKVGYAERTVSNRRKDYKSHNPCAIMRSSCAGAVSAENTCRKQLTKEGASRIKGTEWFSVSRDLFDKLYVEGMGHFKPTALTHILESY